MAPSINPANEIPHRIVFMDHGERETCRILDFLLQIAGLRATAVVGHLVSLTMGCAIVGQNVGGGLAKTVVLPAFDNIGDRVDGICPVPVWIVTVQS